MARRRWAWLIVATAWCALAGSAVAGSSSSVGGEHVVTVPDAAEAWYATLPISTCTSPLGCSPTQTLVSPYPAGTLHVGVVLGQVIERSYVQPDLSRLPAGTTASSGEMTLPVASSPIDGTINAANAHLLACLATQPFAPKTAGSTVKPPSTDCLTSTTPRYDAGKSAFVVDLSPFLAAWNRGRPENGIALIASPSLTDQSSLWQLTIDGLGQTGPAHVTSTVRYVPAPNPSPSSAATPTLPTPPNVQALPPVSPPPVPPASTSGTSSVPPPQVAAPTTTATRPVVFRRGFQYPLAFLFPLLLVVAGSYFMRVFTTPATGGSQDRRVGS